LCEKQIEKVCVKRVKTYRPKEGQLGVKQMAPRYHGDLKHKWQTQSTQNLDIKSIKQKT